MLHKNYPYYIDCIPIVLNYCPTKKIFFYIPSSSKIRNDCIIKQKKNDKQNLQTVQTFSTHKKIFFVVFTATRVI